MKIYYLERTLRTPKIDFNPQTGILKMEGCSLPEDSDEFYKPIYSWLDEYLLHPATETVMIFQLEYYNTAQSIYILKLFTKLEDLADKGYKVSVKWYYEEEDEIMQQDGNNFKSLTTLGMELIMLPY